ncbi:MAG: nucleotidyltransferase domain-containing protein [Oscillospiraceae bacterium]|nr:nucleotidyltransferase domain-containing protein [Oscillospiraceae bacterium]
MHTREDAVKIMHEVYHSCNDLFPCGIQDAYLYGSYARGDYHPESDVDILLTVKMDWPEIAAYRKKVAHIASKLSLEHDITVSVSVNPLDLFVHHPDLPYYENIRTEGIRYAG